MLYTGQGKSRAADTPRGIFLRNNGTDTRVRDNSQKKTKRRYSVTINIRKESGRGDTAPRDGKENTDMIGIKEREEEEVYRKAKKKKISDR